MKRLLFLTSLALSLAWSQPAAMAANPLVRVETPLGEMILELFPEAAPLTVENFLTYVESGDYNRTFVHRSAVTIFNTPFVIQAGSYNSTPEGALGLVNQRDPVVNKYNLSNVRGTIAMAKLGGDPDSATNGWFINMGDNSANLDNQNGGFTVFGHVLVGMDVADAITALPRYNLSPSLPFTEIPLYGELSGPATVDNLVTYFVVERIDRPVLSVSQAGGNLNLAFDSVFGETYILEQNSSSPTTSDPNWSPTGATLEGTGNVINFSVPAPSSGSTFFRVTYD